MKEVKLSKGEVALVDDEDFEKVNAFKWFCDNEGYAVRTIKMPDGKTGKLRMHRFLVNPSSKMDVDHRDHDRLNNQKSNLRICTRAENKRNSTKTKGQSRYKGVSVMVRKIKGKVYSYYRSRILVNGKTIEKLFPFNSEGELMAAIEYNKMAITHFGEFAAINKIAS